MNRTLKYCDEKDKSYGIAGMAVALVVLDGDDYIDSLSLDEPDGHNISFSNEFFFISNPAFSAKTAWNELLKQFQLTAAMLISNLMCRNYVQHRHRLSHDIEDTLRRFIRQQAQEYCSLDTDEADNIYDKSIAYFDRIYSYAQVHEIVDSFVSSLDARRQMSAQEVMESLSRLSMI